jgi:hypothetical protein
MDKGIKLTLFKEDKSLSALDILLVFIVSVLEKP